MRVQCEPVPYVLRVHLRLIHVEPCNYVYWSMDFLFFNLVAAALLGNSKDLGLVSEGMGEGRWIALVALSCGPAFSIAFVLTQRFALGCPSASLRKRKQGMPCLLSVLSQSFRYSLPLFMFGSRACFLALPFLLSLIPQGPITVPGLNVTLPFDGEVYAEGLAILMPLALGVAIKKVMDFFKSTLSGPADAVRSAAEADEEVFHHVMFTTMGVVDAQFPGRVVCFLSPHPMRTLQGLRLQKKSTPSAAQLRPPRTRPE